MICDETALRSLRAIGLKMDDAKIRSWMAAHPETHFQSGQSIS